MRLFIAFAALLGMLVPTAASAQSLNNIVGLLTTGRNISNTASYRCNSSKGIGNILCQAQRLQSIDRQIDYQRRNAVNRQRQEQLRQQRIAKALDKACKAGDQESCSRAGSIDYPQQTKLQQALAEACNAGDDTSCNRLARGSRQLYADQEFYIP